MQEVTVSKDELIETLTQNQKTHQADFEIAWEAFRTKAEENLSRILDDLKHAPRGGVLNLHVGLEAPQNHTEDYERAIAMCQWEQRDEVTLQEHEFTQYVQDKWGWKRGFETANMMYTGSTSPSAARR